MRENPVPVFLDTDIGPDCDDTAALAVLLRLQEEGEARLLGVTHCTGSPYGLGTIDAICRAFGVSVPLGTCDRPDFLSTGDALRYTPSVCAKFPHAWAPGRPQPDAADALVRGLKDAEEDSVTMIAIGPLNNLSRFLADERTAGLMRSRVRRIAAMAGSFSFREGFAEWNVKMDIPAARSVLCGWEKELLLCPFEAGLEVLTGSPLERYPDNPVRTAYTLYNGGGFTRSSWDPATVACAVLEDPGPYEYSEPGRVSLDGEGVTSFLPDPEGNCRIIRLKASPGEAAAWLDGILERALVTMTGGRRAGP